MKHIALLTTALLVAAEGAASAQIPPVTLTIDEAVSRAMEASHRLAEVRAREQGAQAAIEVRRAAEKPSVAVSGGYTRTNHVRPFGVPQVIGGVPVVQLIYPDIPDNYFSRASLQWPIYTAGRLDALERAAEAEARAVAAELTVARADLRLEVVRTYWALVTATEAARVLREALDRADAHLRDVRAMFDAGLIPPNDVSSVEAQRSRQQMQLIEAENLRRSVAEELKRLTGVPSEAEIAIQPPSPPSLAVQRDASFGAAGPPSLQSQAGIPTLVEAALKQRAERQTLLERIAAADERVTAAAAGTKPTVAFLGGVDYANPNPKIFPRRGEWQESWELSVNVSWPVWDGGRSKAEAAEAAAGRTAVRERLADLDSLIAVDVRQRQFDIESARAAIAATADGVRSAQEARRVVAERFSVGVATSTEVLDAQVALLQAELDRTRAIANLRLAEARLERALGR